MLKSLAHLLKIILLAILLFFAKHFPNKESNSSFSFTNYLAFSLLRRGYAFFSSLKKMLPAFLESKSPYLWQKQEVLIPSVLGVSQHPKGALVAPPKPAISTPSPKKDSLLSFGEDSSLSKKGSSSSPSRDREIEELKKNI